MLSAEMLELCYEIEKLPASEQQTKVSVMASDLRNKMLEIEKSLGSSLDEESL